MTHFFRSSSRYGPPLRTEYRLIVENLSSRVSWQVCTNTHILASYFYSTSPNTSFFRHSVAVLVSNVSLLLFFVMFNIFNFMYLFCYFVCSFLPSYFEYGRQIEIQSYSECERLISEHTISLSRFKTFNYYSVHKFPLSYGYIHLSSSIRGVYFVCGKMSNT